MTDKPVSLTEAMVNPIDEVVDALREVSTWKKGGVMEDNKQPMSLTEAMQQRAANASGVRALGFQQMDLLNEATYEDGVQEAQDWLQTSPSRDEVEQRLGEAKYALRFGEGDEYYQGWSDILGRELF